MNRTAMSDSFVKIYIEDSSVLYLNTDGTYVLNNMPFDETKNDSVLLSKDNSCLLQCYSNGYVNKTSITEILRLSYNIVTLVPTMILLLHFLRRTGKNM